MFWLALAAMDQHEWTHRAVQSMAETVSGKGGFHLVIYDQASQQRYQPEEFPRLPFPMSLLHLDINQGYYRLMETVAEQATDADLIGIVHNDVIFHEPDWDQTLIQAFVNRPDMGMLGLCGSWQVDPNGGRGSGTMINFRGDYQQHAQTKTLYNGRHVTFPAVVFDSLFMMMRKRHLPLLRIDKDIQLGHFLDRVWPLRLWEAGVKCGYVGIEIDHAGGITTVSEETRDRFEQDSKLWCESQNIPPDRLYPAQGNQPASTWQREGSYASLMYVEAEYRFLSEYGPKGMVPSWVDKMWSYHRGVPDGHWYQ
jgi:hypothetical protein